MAEEKVYCRQKEEHGHRQRRLGESTVDMTLSHVRGEWERGEPGTASSQESKRFKKGGEGTGNQNDWII